jgi:hypothetical protein
MMRLLRPRKLLGNENSNTQPVMIDAVAESLMRSALELWWQKQNSALETETETRCRMPAP